MLLCTIALALSVPPVPLAAAADKDISCKDAGHFIGGIDRIYKLTIGGPKDKKWEYSLELSPVANMEGAVKGSGTYELVDDLAIFTGKVNKEDICFGVNYGFPGGKVEFNGFFRDGEQTLRYHRKWFQKVGGTWKPLEEVTLSMARTPPAGKQWQIPLKGEHIQWDAAGTEKRTKIDQTVTYDKAETGYNLNRPLPNQIPYPLIPVVAENRLQAVGFVEGHPNPSGILRGFRLPGR